MSGRTRVSFAQERRVRQMLGPAPVRPAAKNIPLVRELPAGVDRAALELALQQLLRRHPALHHRFTDVDGEVVLEPVDLGRQAPIECPTWPVPSGSCAPDDVHTVIRAQADRAFEVTGWPLLRAGVIEGARPLLCVVLDHLVCDGWSLGVVARDLQALHAAAAIGRPAQLGPAGDFTAFAADERRRFSAPAPVSAALRGVRSVLGAGPLEPRLPFDASPWDLASPRYRQLDVLTGPEADAFERRCREGRTTTFAGALAAVGLALNASAGIEAAAMLVAVHNRGGGPSNAGVGWYANMLPLRFGVRAGRPVRETLAHVHRAMMATLEFYDVPLARLEAADGSAHGDDAAASGRLPLFVSFSDDRSAAPGSLPAGGEADGPAWPAVTAAPSYRPGYGVWVSRHDGGLKLVIVSPRPATREAVLAAFESELCEALQQIAAG